MKKYKTREKPFTLEPHAKRKTTVKKNKINLNSSGDDDIIENELFTNSESNVNSENQSEAEIANNLLNVTNDTSENESKESEHQTSKGKEKANNVAEGGCTTYLKPKKKSKLKKKQKKQKIRNQKNEKDPIE